MLTSPAFQQESPTGAAARRCLRLMVVDDHDLFRGGLRTLLEHEGYKVVEATGGEAALRLARSFRPDVVVMDMNMPGISGIEATRMLLVEHPNISVLMLTGASEDEGVLHAVRAGASGYLLKDSRLPEIVAGIEAAAAGHSAIAPRVAPALLASVRDATRTQPATTSHALSDGERTMLALVAGGCDNVEIAERLYVSTSTVKSRLSRLFERLGVQNRVQAAAFAARHGLAELEA